MEFDESSGSQEAHENLEDVGDEPLREAMKNILEFDPEMKFLHLKSDHKMQESLEQSGCSTTNKMIKASLLGIRQG